MTKQDTTRGIELRCLPHSCLMRIFQDMIKANLRVHPASLLNGEGVSIPLKLGQNKGAVRYSQAACISEDDAPITIPEHELLKCF